MADMSVTPRRLDLKKDERLLIEWDDGTTSLYSITYLRSMCPCAMCKVTRSGQDPHQLLQPQKKGLALHILPGNYTGAVIVKSAEMVGTYALKLTFSDDHDSGIFSFQYLREIAPASRD